MVGSESAGSRNTELNPAPKKAADRINLSESSGGKILPPDILKFDSYRSFLAAFYQYKKNLRASFSFRQFSALAGLKSPNYLQLVIQGKRNLTHKTASELCEFFKFNSNQKEYFLGLINLENASCEEEKQQAQTQMRVALKRALAKRISADAKKVFTKWFYFVVREMVLLPDFEASADYISNKTKGMISLEEAEDALRTLVQLGMLQQNTSGELEQKDPVLSTDETDYLYSQLCEFHADTLKKWSQVLPHLPKQQTETHILNIPINREKLPELQVRIQRFQEEIIGWLQKEREPDVIVQLGTYLVPVTIE